MSEETKTSENYGKITVGIGSDPRDINIESFVQADFKDHRLISVSELENNEGFILCVENPESTGRHKQQTMWLSRESFIGLINTAHLFWMSKNEDMQKLLLESLDSKEVRYTASNNLEKFKEQLQ